MKDLNHFISANPYVTAVHIQLEWYFLFAYAIYNQSLKKGGLVALVLYIAI